MRLTQVSTPWMAVVCLAAAAAARIDNNQVISIGDDTTTLTSDSTNLFIPTRTTLPTANSPGASFNEMTTASPGSISVNQGDQHIEQGPDGAKTVINGDQTIIDGPSGKTIIQGGQTIIQTKATRGTGGGQTTTQVDGESTGGAALATGVPFAGAIMAVGGAMMLF